MCNEMIDQLADRAVERILSEMRPSAPYMAQQAADWFTRLAGGSRPAAYFLHPLAFPMLHLPWWMEQTVDPSPDVEFQADLVYSSVNGYYFIRMIDNVMDGHSTVEPKLLPMLGFFHLHFHAVYERYFPHNHPFWAQFSAIAIQSAESALRDAALTEIDLDTFVAVSGAKVAGGKIPLAAVAHRYGQPHRFDAWQAFYDRLGCWHQLYNDLFGWVKDLDHQTPSYFLSEGRRRKRPTESEGAWVIREGFAWAVELLDTWLGELSQLAEELHSPALTGYLHQRRVRMRQQSAQVVQMFERLGSLFDG